MAWSSLPDDLLLEIARNLVLISDFVRFRVVCKSWRSAVQPDDLPPQLPWVMLYDKSYKGDIEKCCFYSLGAETVNVLHLPEFRNKHFCGGSCDGWLVLLDKTVRDTKALSLLQPLTRSYISLPLPEKGKLVTEAHLSGSPTSGQCMVVAWNGFWTDELYYCKLGLDRQWRQWTIIPTPTNCVRTVVVSHDQENMYAMNSLNVYHFDLKNMTTRVIPLPDNMRICQAYLAVASSGELLLAVDFWQSSGPPILEVCTLKDEGWVKSQGRSIDNDQVFYLSPCQSFSSDVGQSDHIYLACNNYGHSSDVRQSDHIYLACNNYVHSFSLKDGGFSMQKIPWHTVGDDSERLHHNTWFFPSLCP